MPEVCCPRSSRARSSRGTSSPYWGMRTYETSATFTGLTATSVRTASADARGVHRHSVEILHLMKPAIDSTGSVWWNIMDTYNTRRRFGRPLANASTLWDRPLAHGRAGTSHRPVGTAPATCTSPTQSSAPFHEGSPSVHSRIGYKLKSYITWRKHASRPSPQEPRLPASRVHPAPLARCCPVLRQSGWQPRALPRRAQPTRVARKITDVCQSHPPRKNGHGAEFPLALAARCVALTSRKTTSF